jgi:preprotein translocase subunit Sss1
MVEIMDDTSKALGLVLIGIVGLVAIYTVIMN